MEIIRKENTTGPITFIGRLEEFDMMFTGHIMSGLDRDTYIE